MDAIIQKLLNNTDLNSKEALELIQSYFNSSNSMYSNLLSLLLLRKKGESAVELLSAVQLLRKKMNVVHHNQPFAVDFCGTGGDGKNTFNISTIAALIAAGAGAQIIKHGNRSISSQCGSSDLLEAFGYSLELKKSDLTKLVKKSNFTYLHAPFYHPAFAKIQPIRQKLKIKSIFNFLGPLLNPAKVKNQIIGVSEPSLVGVYIDILKKLGSKHVWVFMSEGGYDEISLTGDAHGTQLYKRKIQKHTLSPSDFGMKKINPKDLNTKNLKENKRIALDILQGKEKGPRRNVVLANAALGLFASGRASSIKEGVALGLYSIETGRAYAQLKKAIEISNGIVLPS